MKQGKTNVVDQAFLVDENPGYATKDTHPNKVKQTLDKKIPTRERHGFH